MRLKRYLTESEIFDEFIFELSKAKAEALGVKETASEVKAIKINKELSRFITECSAILENGSMDYGTGIMQELMYVMSAVADEVFIHMEWCGKDYWNNNLIENQFFKTHAAGEELFNKIDNILIKKSYFSTDMAVVYLKALAIGFMGKYRGAGGNGIIGNYKKKLYKFITALEEEDINSDTICKQGYRFTITGLPKIFLPNEYSFDHIFYTFIILFLIGGSIFWEMGHIKIKEAIVQLDGTNKS